MPKTEWPVCRSQRQRARNRSCAEPASSGNDNMTSRRRQLVRRFDGKVVGTVIDDVLTKRVRGSVHMLRIPKAWAIDVAVLILAKAMGANQVEVIDTETGTTYRAAIGAFWRDDVQEFDRGYGKQRLVLLDDWLRVGEPVQSALFDLVEVGG